jgi:heterodisulfide reductase subunit A
VVRLEEASDPARWPCATVVDTCDVLCSEDGQAWLKERIERHGLDRVVIAGCSPKEHEADFQRVLAASGLNPYMLQVVNIREQCEWIGGTRDEATAKATALVQAGMGRVALHEPIERSEIDCNPDVLVIGAGAAGISAAITLSQKGRNVFLVEKTFALGGRVFLLDETYPGMECASCFLEPALDKVLHDERIQVITGAEVGEVTGSYGNFSVTVHRKPRFVDPEACIGCRTCASVCPVEYPDPYSGGLGLRKAVDLPFEGCLPHLSAVDPERCIRFQGDTCDACAQSCPFEAIWFGDGGRDIQIRCGAVVVATGSSVGDPPDESAPGDILSTFQMERLMHPNGPTTGKIACASGEQPTSILFALSENAREEGALGWMELLKLAERTRHKLPGTGISLAGGPAWTLGAGQDLVKGLLESGAEFHPAFLAGIAKNSLTGRPVAILMDGKGTSRVPADLVVVHTRSLPSEGAERLGGALGIRSRPNRFFQDRADPFEPSFSGVAGVYVAGAAGGPRSIAASIEDGAAAAARILSRLVPGEKIPLEPLTSAVDETLCSDCGICRCSCPYGAITRDRELGVSRVVAAICRGCGTCAAACPSGAIKAKHFTGGQLAEEIRSLLQIPHPSGD